VRESVEDCGLTAHVTTTYLRKSTLTRVAMTTISPSTLFRRVEFAANVALVVVAIAICVVTWQKFRAPQRAASAPWLAPGTKIPLPWHGARQTLLIAVRKGCPVCDQQAASLRELKLRAEAKQVTVVALVPDSASLDAEYLEKFGLTPAMTRQVVFSTVGIAGVPAVVEVDAQGIVKRSWRGPLLNEGTKSWDF